MTDKYERVSWGKIWAVIQAIKGEMIVTGSKTIEIKAQSLCGGNIEIGKKILSRLIRVDGVVKIISTPKEHILFIMDKSSGNTPIKLEIIKEKFDKFADEVERKYKGMATEYQAEQKDKQNQFNPSIDKEKHGEFRLYPNTGKVKYQDKMIKFGRNSARYKILSLLWEFRDKEFKTFEELLRVSGRSFDTDDIRWGDKKFIWDDIRAIKDRLGIKSDDELIRFDSDDGYMLSTKTPT